jgi:hypothetical protein
LEQRLIVLLERHDGNVAVVARDAATGAGTGGPLGEAVPDRPERLPQTIAGRARRARGIVRD